MNRMEVKPPVVADSADVHSAIERALERQAEREAQRIEVKVKDGAVGLTGIVHTWREKDAVLGAVRGTRGVREVADHLSVQPYA